VDVHLDDVLANGLPHHRRFAHVAPSIRTELHARAPPPSAPTASNEAQLVLHLRAVLGETPDPLAAFQVSFQRPLLG
jgi:hypothetical protein